MTRRRTAIAVAVLALVVVAAVVAVVALTHDGGDDRPAPAAFPVQHFHSRPDLRPPPVSVTMHGAVAPGYVFIAPKTKVTQAGPLILDDQGRVVWFHPLDTKGVTDFKVQSYGGRPVLTWWRGKAEKGVGDGYYVIADDHYRQIATVSAGSGLAGDVHEFLITPQNTALFTVYRRLARDLGAVGGPAEGSIYEGVLQEVDIATGKVLFEWHSADHVALTESYAQPPKASRGADADPYDYFHVNSIDIEPSGDLVVSARNTHAIYEIRKADGAIVWRLGGKRSDFTMGPGTSFAWQHDARSQPDGTLSVFDNSADPKVAPHSRAILLSLDTGAMRATLLRSYVHPRKLSSGSQGNVQLLDDGHVFVGWGVNPDFTEFTRDGDLLLDGTFGSEGTDSYRAYRFTWHGQPLEPPAVATEAVSNGRVAIWVSWNGATDVARWQVLAGPDAQHLTPIETTPRTGFETKLVFETDAKRLQMRALDTEGIVLGGSRVVALESS